MQIREQDFAVVFIFADPAFFDVVIVSFRIDGQLQVIHDLVAHDRIGIGFEADTARWLLMSW